MAIEKYLNLVTSEHRNKPNFIAWLTSALEKVEDAAGAISGITSAFDIDNAEGVQLDAIGEIVGRKRTLEFQPSDGSAPKLSDSAYRMVLKAKVLQNQWDGTIPGVHSIWKTVFPQYDLIIEDNQNMTMKVTVVGTSTPLQNILIQNHYIVPKPAGVGVIYEFSETANLNLYLGFAVQEGVFETVKQTS